MTTPTDDQLAAAYEARADHETAREIAARLLAPPDPVDILAGVIADRGEVADERDELLAERDALTADLAAIRGMVCRSEVPIVEAVRRYCDDDREVKNGLRRQRDDASRWIGQIAVALGLSEYAPAVAVRDRAKDVRDEVAHLTSERDQLQARVTALTTSAESRERTIHDLTRDRDAISVARKQAIEESERLGAFLKAAEDDAETQRTAVADLRAALDRVAAAVGVESDSTGAIVADRVIAVVLAQKARPVLTVERLADALRAANVTLQPTTTALAVMATMSHMGDLVLPASPPASRQAALPADLRAYLEARRDRLVDVSGLSAASEIAALTGWIASPTAEVTK